MKKISKLLTLILCAVLLSATVFTGCGGGESELIFNSADLESAVVGVYYSADLSENVDATGTVKYSLKEGVSLPKGLELSSAGVVSGTPEKAGEYSFSVVASNDEKTAEATFKLTAIKGALSYDAATVRVVKDEESATSVALAKNGVNVKYSLVEGELPNGLTLNEDGLLSGTPTKLNQSSTVKIKATAEDCTEAVADITVRVTNPWLKYEGSTLSIATVGQYYTAFIGTASGSNKAITYALAAGSPAPKGLRLSGDGMIYGVPTVKVTAYTFDVVAKSTGYDNERVTFTVTVRAAKDVSPNSGHVSFNGGKIPDAELEAQYLLTSVAAENPIVKAKATNRNEVRYSVADGDSLPAGLKLYDNGTIFGTPTVSGDFTFTLKASADNCTPVTAQFTMTINNAKVPYGPRINLEKAEVGTAYTADVGKADVPEGVKVTYSVKEGRKLPDGLTLSEDGKISGTPTKAVKNHYFAVIAKAEGYGDGECEVYITVQSAITKVANGRLEAEYIDLTGKSGGGYSGSASEEGLVQKDSSYGASNGYYVGYLHTTITLEFRFTSSVTTDTQVSLALGLATELGTVTFDPSNMEISVNGSVHNYSAITLIGQDATHGSFTNNAAGTITIKPGENVITISIKDNTLMQGTRVGGPSLDYIELGTDTISWRPCEYNFK